MQSELEKVAWFQYFALLLIKKKTKFCKQKKIGWFEYFGDSDVVNKLNDPAFTRSRFWTRFFSNDQVHPPYDQGANWLGVFFLTFLMGLLIRYLETLTIQNVFLFLLRTNLWIKEENLWTFPFYGPLNTSYRPTHGCATATTLGDWPFFATCVAKAKVKPSNLFFQTTSGSNACKFFNI